MVEDAEVNHSGVTLPVLLRVGKNSCRVRTPATRRNGPRVADEEARLKLELSQGRHRHRTADRHGLGCEGDGTDEAGLLIPRRTAAAPRLCDEPGMDLLHDRSCPHAPRPRGRAKAVGRSRELGSRRRARTIAGRSLPCLRTGRRFDHVLSLHGRGARPVAAVFLNRAFRSLVLPRFPALDCCAVRAIVWTKIGPRRARADLIHVGYGNLSSRSRPSRRPWP